VDKELKSGKRGRSTAGAGDTAARYSQERRPALLIVDDSADNRFVLTQVVAEYLPEWDVTAASGAAEGLALARKTAFDAALIDLQMPNVDGIEMCRRLKRNISTALIPVALITSHSVDPRTKAEGLEAGADDFIKRPIDNLELVARIRVMLRIKQAEDEYRRINAHLEDLVQVRTARLEEYAKRQTALSHKIITAQEEERARLSRELHDELGQILTAVRLELDLAKKELDGRAEVAGASIDKAVEMVEKAAGEIRLFCRGLRPPLLDDLGVESAVSLLIEEFEQTTQIRIELEIDLHEDQNPIPAEIALCVYRIIQESLNNITRHARAAMVDIRLSRAAGELSLVIRDDGRGFDPEGSATEKGIGLIGMQERASLINGRFFILSDPGRGTRVELKVPLDS
jgi:signal transduction histidine kinase